MKPIGQTHQPPDRDALKAIQLRSRWIGILSSFIIALLHLIEQG